MHKLNGASDDARIRLREWELPEVRGQGGRRAGGAQPAPYCVHKLCQGNQPGALLKCCWVNPPSAPCSFCHVLLPLLQALHALDAGTVAALPDAVRVELEGIQEGGGLQHLQEVAQQIRVGGRQWAGGQGGGQVALWVSCVGA